MTKMGDSQRDIQGLDKPENFELRKRKPSPLPNSGELLQPQDATEASRHLSTSSDPLPSSTSLSSFRSLIATNTKSGNIKLSQTASPSTCLFYVRNGSIRPKTPSIAVSVETKQGPIIGTLKLSWGRNNTFGLGDPDKDASISWENLKGTSRWSHATYEFEFGRVERKCYVWQRTKQGMFSDQPNLELREKLPTGEMGEVLAVYTGNQGLMWTSRGQFWLSPHLHTEGATFWSGNNSGEWSELELMVLLSALGIIESSRRRARSRRSGGGG